MDVPQIPCHIMRENPVDPVRRKVIQQIQQHPPLQNVPISVPNYKELA